MGISIERDEELFLLILCILAALVAVCADHVHTPTRTRTPVPEDCSLVMAPSTISGAGWGVFLLYGRKQGDLVSEHGDIVLHLTDPNPATASGMKRLIWEYLWDGQEVGGQYEGQRVMSVVPGIGMLANGEISMFNVRPNKPSIDNVGVMRSSPASGSFTHYHNLTWIVDNDMDAGSELFLNYGEGWFRERGYDLQDKPVGRRPLEWLREHGYCLDNLKPSKSTIKDAGRGVFASRFINEGEIVVPVPLMLLTRDSLKTIKEHESGRIVVTEQLLRNYCFGHVNSSVLLYPYGGMVNMINHESVGFNVELRWSDLSASFLHLPLSEHQNSSIQLLLELVATRPIEEGDEILLDYGKDWNDAWDRHVSRWRPEAATDYVSSLIANQDASSEILRTAAEQLLNPYPQNIFTSCFYYYEANEDHLEHEISVWRPSAGLMATTRNLRPCAVLDRHVGSDGELLYTVRMFNRPGLTPLARLPKGKPCIVTGVPRYAIEFSDKLYTTDQHLENAFRKEIGMSVFPSKWMDLGESR